MALWSARRSRRSTKHGRALLGGAPAAAQQLAKDLRRLGTGDPERAVDDEERHAADTKASGRALVLADVLGISLRIQHLPYFLGREAHLGRETLERRRLADRNALGEVAVHHS